MKLSKDINKRILKAHQQKDRKYLALIYERYGRSQLEKNNIDAGCFFLTHAYIFALEEGLNCATRIHKALKNYGREA